MKGNGVTRRRAGWTLVGLVLAAGFAWAVVRSQALPDGPRPVVWDRQPCAECGMSVSDPRFACQLQTEAGDVLDFDDPGCLFRHLVTETAPVHALYFHADEGDRWLARDEVAFVPVPHSPMGYDLAAVPSGGADALDFETARARTLTAEASHVAR
jgi:hypothetical protein